MSNLTAPTRTLPGAVIDGTPHLAYYDRASNLSFVWTGHPDHPIHVQAGGYGEPTTALINLEGSYPGGHETPAEAFTWFREACDTWNHAWDGETGVIESGERFGNRSERGCCTHHLAGGPLICTNPHPHEPGHGCTYTSTSGSWLETE